jgi:hypothetical protein
MSMLKSMVEIYAAQKGVCAYSGLPLRFGKGDWMISLERLDPTKNYSRTNCALVCHEFNTTDKSVLHEGYNTGLQCFQHFGTYFVIVAQPVHSWFPC